MAEPLLLVGWRGEVRPALRELSREKSIGRIVALVAGPPPRAEELDDVREVDLHGDPDHLRDAAGELLNGERPGAVVALAERTVLAAAGLRSSFGLGGNGPDVALRCADKLVMKEAMDAAGVPVARWRRVDPQTNASDLVAALGLPIVLKPRRDSGGRGQTRVDGLEALTAALANLTPPSDVGNGWLAEGWVEGTEMSVETFVHDGRPVFANPTAYHVPRHANVLPAALAPEVWSSVREFSSRALRAAGVERGITHLELFRDGSEIVFGELAIRPPGGRLMRLIQRAWGFDPWERLLRLELGQACTFPEKPLRAAGAWVLHPGSGNLLAIRGQEEARAVPLVRRLTLKISPDQLPRFIPERTGSGQDLGAIYAEGERALEVAAALTKARGHLVFELA